MSTRTVVDNSRRREVEVNFTVAADCFSVPEWPGLRCTAEFEAYGFVTYLFDGDHVTPDGPPSVNVGLLDPKSYSIYVIGEDDRDVSLPEWLGEQLVTRDAGEFDAAFLEAIGGQEALDQRAIEEAT